MAICEAERDHRNISPEEEQNEPEAAKQHQIRQEEATVRKPPSELEQDRGDDEVAGALSPYSKPVPFAGGCET